MNTFDSFPLFTVFQCDEWHTWVKVSNVKAVCLSDSMRVKEGEVRYFDEYPADQKFLIIK